MLKFVISEISMDGARVSVTTDDVPERLGVVPAGESVTRTATAVVEDLKIAHQGNGSYEEAQVHGMLAEAFLCGFWRGILIERERFRTGSS